VNLQGDLPSVDAKTLQATLNLLNDEAVDIGTPVIKIKDTKEIENPNVVKASFSSPLVGEAGWGVASANSEGQHSARGETPLPTLPTRGRAKINSGRALAFSRAAIPANDGNYYHHIGIYAYRRKALEKFVHLPPSENEKREKLEQLRAMDAGMRIDVAIVDAMPMTIDTPEDLERARKIIR
jgi:3-deoxy-manno-octulosonate cytidylyltransferase (CMP-KDO synthetase)